MDPRLADLYDELRRTVEERRVAAFLKRTLSRNPGLDLKVLVDITQCMVGRGSDTKPTMSRRFSPQEWIIGQLETARAVRGTLPPEQSYRMQTAPSASGISVFLRSSRPIGSPHGGQLCYAKAREGAPSWRSGAETRVSRRILWLLVGPLSDRVSIPQLTRASSDSHELALKRRFGSVSQNSRP